MCIRDRYQRRVRGEERMVKSEGYRCCTRDQFSRPFRQRGMPNLSTYLVNYKVGDYVDIKANSAIQQGMPHKTYHGRTGVVWNVTKRAVGVLVNKQVGGKILAKKIHVRVEHVSKSQCREAFLKRVKANDAAKESAKAAGQPKPITKRLVRGPKPGFQVRTETIAVAPVKYEALY
eukprot:TRINITY_DN1178_c0_g1_i1.p1 TRINITY_DN1178_c0_g1~~TRINITY_DN1178_c0_g1_i1.p1  ORF type:complete len:175 (+),score=75.40 TRINITY_DN1178_c0_g1_i1:146-670(+)